MPKTKGTDIIALHALLREKGPETEKGFLDKLGPRLAAVYRGITATSWTEVEEQLAIYQVAAGVLFPNDPAGLTRLGMALAEKSFSGIYKIFFRLPSIEYIFKRTARIWSAYYDQGEASIETQAGKCVDLVVRNFPELPRAMREVANGHYTVIMNMTGAKNIRINLIDTDPNAWRWRISWD